MTIVASLRGVSKKYGGTLALRPTDLDLRTGVTGLLGPNGAGKSTLLRLLATAQPPSTGTITVAGHDVTGSLADRTEARRRLGYLPQEVGLPRRSTAFDFLDYIAVLKEWTDTRARHQEVRRVLDLVDLGEPRQQAHLRTLGWAAPTAVHRPGPDGRSRRSSSLDEPTTGLDPEQRASLRGLLSEQARTSGVLLATHQTEDVSALCDRVIVLDGGAVCFDGTVPELVATAAGQVWVGDEANDGALSSWRTGSGAVRSIGGTPRPDAQIVEPAVEDAYLLMRATTRPHEGAVP